MKRALIVTVLSLALIYLGDYTALRSRAQPYGKVTIQNYYAVPRKDGKTEYVLEDPAVKTCVHSLFPHFGYAPCWYLARKTESRENI